MGENFKSTKKIIMITICGLAILHLSGLQYSYVHGFMQYLHAVKPVFTSILSPKQWLIWKLVLKGDIP